MSTDNVLDDIEERERNHDDSPIITVTVDGNYGAGKTTLIRQMAQIDGVLIFEEPIATEWHEVWTLSFIYQTTTSPMTN